MECKRCEHRVGFCCAHPTVGPYKHHRLGKYCDHDDSPIWCPLKVLREEPMRCTNKDCDNYDKHDSGHKNCDQWGAPEENCNWWRQNVSTHGVCYDNGQSGKCDLDCEVYQEGDCEAADEVLERLSSKKYSCSGCQWENNDSFHCGHPRCGTDNNDTEVFNENDVAPLWCPQIRLAQKSEATQKENDMTDFTAKSAQVKNNAVNAMETAKDTFLVMQRGASVVTAVKVALKNAPGTPAPLKALMDTPYGDMVVGLILHTAAPVLTGNTTILKAVKDANVVGAVEVSRQFTFIQDTIEQAILAIPGMAMTAVEHVKDAIDTPEGERMKAEDAFSEYDECPECKGMFKSDTMRDGLCHNCWNHADTDKG